MSRWKGKVCKCRGDSFASTGWGSVGKALREPGKAIFLFKGWAKTQAPSAEGPGLDSRSGNCKESNAARKIKDCMCHNQDPVQLKKEIFV